MKNSIFARFARALFIFWHFEDVLALFTTWNDLFCSCVDDVRIWWQMFNFVFLCPQRWFQSNSRLVRTHFSSIMTLNNRKMIAETLSYIFHMTLSIPSTSCFLKLPKVDSVHMQLSRQAAYKNSELMVTLSTTFLATVTLAISWAPK